MRKSRCLLCLQEVEKEEVEELPGKKPRTKTVRPSEYCYEAQLEGEAPAECAVADQCLQPLLPCTNSSHCTKMPGHSPADPCWA